jgi:hypothetical protein
MGDRLRHAQHVVRVGVVFAVVLVIFLVARSQLIPSDFGVYGYYRAGALNDSRALPVVHAGRVACLECHDGTYDPPEPDEEAAPRKPLPKSLTAKDNKHSILSCEACHGPLKFHVDDTEKDVSKVAADSLCLNCHQQIGGRPRSQPQVMAATHEKDDPAKQTCVSCHLPHWPKTEEAAGN